MRAFTCVEYAVSNFASITPNVGGRCLFVSEGVPGGG